MQNLSPEQLHILSLIENLDKQNIIKFLEKLSPLSKNDQNKDIVDYWLSLDSFINFVGKGNTKYLAKFMNFLAKNKSIALKNKAVEMIDTLGK